MNMRIKSILTCLMIIAMILPVATILKANINYIDKQTSTDCNIDKTPIFPLDPQNPRLSKFNDPSIPSMTLTNTTIYWGFAHRIDVSVKDFTGSGITDGTVKIIKGNSATYIDDHTYGDLWINETGNGYYSIEIQQFIPGSSNWTNLKNGSWYVYFSKDVNGDGIEEWNSSRGSQNKFLIQSTFPPLEFEITEINGGIGVNAIIKNTGALTIGILEWSINVTGGLLNLIEAHVNGNETKLEPNATITAETGSLGFLHLGPLKISVMAKASHKDKVEMECIGFIFGPYVFILRPL